MLLNEVHHLLGECGEILQRGADIRFFDQFAQRIKVLRTLPLGCDALDLRGEHLEHVLEVDRGETIPTHEVDDVGEHLTYEDVLGGEETCREERVDLTVIALDEAALATLRIVQDEGHE